MSEIQHSQLAQHLANTNPQELPSICLLHGQQVLVEESLEQLISLFLGDADRSICCDVVDGFDENLSDALERINTFSLLAGPKIVIFKEAKLLETRGGSQNRVDQIDQAYSAGDLAKASKLFFNLCRQLGTDPQEALQQRTEPTELTELKALMGNDKVNQMRQYGLERGWSSVDQGDHRANLQRAIEQGFPDRHRFLITTGAKVPKNLKLYKLINELGLIVNCHVPLGSRRADKAVQQSILQQSLDKLLSDAGKRMAPGQFDKLCRLTGFDLRTFNQNIEKLIDYTGSRDKISSEDIDAVLRRTKSDPVYELTNAVADRNAPQALFYLNTLLNEKWHPLQILSAMVNQIRKLIIAKDFLQSQKGRMGIAGLSYPQFQSKIMPIIETYDNKNQKQIVLWDEANPAPAKRKAKTKKATAGVRLAPNPRNAYPVYQTLAKAEKFSMDELTTAMQRLNHADLKLKSSAQDASLVVKSLLLEICGARPN